MNKIIWETPNISYDDLKSSFAEIPEEFSDNPMFNEMEFEEPNKYFNTPFGMFEVADPFSPMKRTELRIGYTDFTITKDVAKIINDAEGVDALRVISRYCFIIGVGRAFNFTEVRNNLEAQLGCIDNPMEELVSKLNGKKYAIFVFPNGNYEYTTSEDPDFIKIIENFKVLREKTKGTIIQN